MLVEVRGTTCVIRVAGRFDFNSYADFQTAARHALTLSGVREHEVDLQSTDYLDSSALGMLLNFNDEVLSRGRRTVLTHANGLVREILDIANMATIMAVR